MITINELKDIVINHKSLGEGKIVDLKDDVLYLQFGEQVKGFQLPFAFESFHSVLKSDSDVVKKLIEEIKIKNSTCCLCGKVVQNIKKHKDQLLCFDCFSNAERCCECGRKVHENSLSYEEAQMCSVCFDKFYFKCDVCNEYYSNWYESKSNIIPQEQRWCTNCITTCEVCEEEFKKEDLIKFDHYYYLCSNCVKTHLKKCQKCRQQFIANEQNQKFCKDCNDVISFEEFLSTVDLSDYYYVSYSFYDFCHSKTVELMSRLNGSCNEDPFDILFLSNSIGEKLVLVDEYSKLYGRKAIKKYYDSCTLTEFKKSNLFYKLTREKFNIISTIKWSDDEVIDVWSEPVWIRAQTYADMDYRKEWIGGDLVYEGNNYGDASDFYIIGKMRKINK